MDSQVHLTVTLWVGGFCVTGFLFLVTWIRMLSESNNKKVSYEWLEKNLVNKVDDIKKAICGDIDKEGLASRVIRIEQNCTLHRDVKDIRSSENKQT